MKHGRLSLWSVPPRENTLAETVGSLQFKFMPEWAQPSSILVIACALPAEGRPLAEALGLSGAADPVWRDCFCNEEETRWLVISGSGKVAQAAAMGAALAVLGERKKGPLRAANAGLAGAADPEMPLGKLFQMGKVLDEASGQTFFPDLLTRSKLELGELHTMEHPAPPRAPGSQGRALPRLYDMECAGFWRACQYSLPSDAIQSVKVVSDHGVEPGEQVDFRRMTKAWEEALPGVVQFIEDFQQLPEPEKAQLSKGLQEPLEELAQRWKLTVGQQTQLERTLIYHHLQGADGQVLLDRRLKEPPPLHARDRNVRWRQLCDELLES